MKSEIQKVVNNTEGIVGKQNFAQGLPRSQTEKRKTALGESFTIFRPVSPESASQIYQTLDEVLREGLLPEQTEIRSPDTMRVTYIERNKLNKQLKGFAAGFNSFEAVARINNRCEGWYQNLAVSLGSISMMDRRDESAVARLYHDQQIAKEYDVIAEQLSLAGIKGMFRERFRPHVSLVRIPGATGEDKKFLEQELRSVIPDEVELQPLQTFPNKLHGNGRVN